MKFKLAAAILFICFVTIAVSAQEPGKTNGEPAGQSKKVEPKYSAKDYEDIVAKLKNGDTNVDFTMLRMGFVETREYSFRGSDKKAVEKFSAPFNDKKFKDALKEAEKFIEKNYVDANAHYVAYNSAKEIKDDAKAEFHKAVLLGLLNSIKNGNDGLSAKSPFKVITVDEEYTMLRFLGYKVMSQSLNHIDGHTFDVFTAADNKTNEKVTIYFNIDVVWAAETKLFGG